MTYEEFINNILETRGRFECGDEYHERHHILPKCMGGTDDEDNLIDLLPQEHYEAHRLLALENSDNDKLQYAWWYMCHCKRSGCEYEVSADEYSEAKIRISDIMKNRYISDDTRKKLSEASKRRHHTEESRKKISEANKGRIFSEETRQKLSEAAKNRPHMSEDTRKKISDSLSGENNYNYKKHLSEDIKRKISEGMRGKFVGEKNPMYGKSGKDSPTAKSVEQYDLDGNLIRVWGSARQAAKELGIPNQNISSCCSYKDKRITAGGFKWRYKDEYEEEQEKTNA